MKRVLSIGYGPADGKVYRGLRCGWFRTTKLDAFAIYLDSIEGRLYPYAMVDIDAVPKSEGSEGTEGSEVTDVADVDDATDVLIRLSWWRNEAIKEMGNE